MARFYNYREWLQCLVDIAEIEKRLKHEPLDFKERIDLGVKLQILRDRFWEIAQSGS